MLASPKLYLGPFLLVHAVMIAHAMFQRTARARDTCCTCYRFSLVTIFDERTHVRCCRRRLLLITNAVPGSVFVLLFGLLIFDYARVIIHAIYLFGLC